MLVDLVEGNHQRPTVHEAGSPTSREAAAEAAADSREPQCLHRQAGQREAALLRGSDNACTAADLCPQQGGSVCAAATLFSFAPSKFTF